MHNSGTYFNQVIIIIIFAIEFLSSLCILDIDPLLDTWFSHIISHSLGYSFTLLIVSFAVQELFNLGQTVFLILLLLPVFWGSYLKIITKASIKRLFSW